MNLYKSYPLHLPSDGQVVWAISYNYYATPFTAVYYTASQTFISYPDNIVFPAYMISRWKPNTTVVPILAEQAFRALDYNINNLNASAAAWLATSNTAFNNYALCSTPLLADGYLVTDVVNALPNTTGSSYIGLNSINTNSSPNVNPYWAYTVFVNTNSTGINIYYNNVLQLFVGGLQLNDRIRLRRTGNTIYVDRYRAGVWSNLYTYATTINGTLYMHIAANTSGFGSGVKNPKFYIG